MPDGSGEGTRGRSAHGCEHAPPVAAPKRYKAPSEQDLEAYLFDFGLERPARDERMPA
jgi:hypothetical protein